MNRFFSGVNVGDTMLKGFNTFTQVVALHMNARAIKILPMSQEDTAGFLERVAQSETEKKYYRDSAIALWSGMSIETFNAMNLKESEEIIRKALLEEHSPDLVIQ